MEFRRNYGAARRHSVWIAKRAVKSFKPEVVVGFSWGGAVAAKLCTHLRIRFRNAFTKGFAL